MSETNPTPAELRIYVWMDSIAKGRGRYEDGVEGALRTIRAAHDQDKDRYREIAELEALWSLPDDPT